MLAKFMSTLAAPKPDRRSFLLGSLATAAGLSVGFRVLEASAGAAPAEAAPGPFQSYIDIDSDGIVTIRSSQFDMGQGAYFGIATLVNEELGADWSTIRVEGASGNVKLFGNMAWGGAAQGTGGSTSMASSWERYRKAGAAARMLLLQAAADAWSVPVGELTVENGTIRHGSGKSGSFGAFALAAAKIAPPADVPLKSKAEWTQIGNDKLKRFDSAAKTNGTHPFTIDLKLDGMKTAVMIHPPRFGGVVKSFDASKAKGLKGFHDVVVTPRGVAVVADTMWAALKARDAVTVEWDDSKAEKRGSAELLASYRDAAAKPGAATARNDGDVAAGFAGAAKVLEATFEFPYLAHAALEPLNAVARMQDGVLEIWGGHQMPDLYGYIASQVAGLTPDKVRLHVMKTGGGFGRRAVADADVIVEAVAVAQALGWKHPVKVQWTRENDMRGGRYRPAYVHRAKAGLDANGKLVAWENHIVGQSILAGTPFEGGMVRNGVDVTSVEGSSNLPYAIPNLKVDLTTMAAGVPVLWWRAVGSTHTAYAVEAFLDEVAEAAGQDPVAFRLAMLDQQPRHKAVLTLAAEKAGWGTPPPAGRVRGVALAESFGTVVAQVVELSTGANGSFKVERVVCAVDCGTAINPDQIRAQMEGGVGFGLGAILSEELTLTEGVVDQSNYDAYTPLRIDQMPVVEVHILPSDAAPTGVGEPGVPPIGPAVANALYAATKKRVRVLPIAKGLTA